MPRNNHNETGNVFLFILLGVALFGALAFVIARGFRSDTTTAMTERQAELAAVDLISFSQRLERAVSKIQQRGVSENDLSFENPSVSGYDHTPAADAKAQIFNPSGGGMNWYDQPANANDGSPWLFTGSTCIGDIGTGASGCDGDHLANEELIAILPNVNANLCTAINKKLGIGSIPTNSGGHSTDKFTGTFADGAEINIGAARNAGCFQEGSNYFFYTVLIAR